MCRINALPRGYSRSVAAQRLLWNNVQSFSGKLLIAEEKKTKPKPKMTCANFELISIKIAAEELKSSALKMMGPILYCVLVKAPVILRLKFILLSCLQISLGPNFVFCSCEMSPAVLTKSKRDATFLQILINSCGI